MTSVRRMNVAFDSVMATMWTFKAMVDSEPEAASEDARLEEALDAMVKVTSELNEAIQAVLRGC